MSDPQVIDVHLARRPQPFRPSVSIVVLTFGRHLDLAARCVESLLATVPPGTVELWLAANAPAPDLRAWAQARLAEGSLQGLLLSPVNLFKIPMLRAALRCTRGEHLWWFDDDSHVTEPDAFDRWARAVQNSSPRIVGWGATALAHHPEGFDTRDQARRWVETADWYRGNPPPHAPGGPEHWWFLTGGCWWMRRAALQALGWPDPRLIHRGEDVLLGEAIRQQGWFICNLDHPGVAISNAPRRTGPENAVPLDHPVPPEILRIRSGPSSLPLDRATFATGPQHRAILAGSAGLARPDPESHPRNHLPAHRAPRAHFPPAKPARVTGKRTRRDPSGPTRVP